MSDRKPDMSEMTASEVAMRKFLKQLGVTTHQQLEQLLQARVRMAWPQQVTSCR